LKFLQGFSPLCAAGFRFWATDQPTHLETKKQQESRYGYIIQLPLSISFSAPIVLDWHF
jgi:hypothetical protein